MTKSSRGSSINLKRVASPLLCELHNRRVLKPGYLLPEQHRLPNLTIRDGNIAEVYGAKMALASGKARHTKDYSPLDEGVVNLSAEATEAELREQMERVIAVIEASGQKVIACEIHRDEGKVSADGKTVQIRNVHAHVVIDRTDERGRVIQRGRRADFRQALRDLQTATARATGLERGVDARESKRVHLTPRQYRALMREFERKGMLRDHDREDTLRRERDASHAVAVDAIRDRETAKSAHADALAVLREIGDKYGVRIERGNKVEYTVLRETMKASGAAQQAEYQRLKAAFDALHARQEVERRRRKRRPGIEGRASEDDGQENAAKARLTRERDEVARMTIWKDSQGREVLHVMRSRVEVLDHSREVEHVALRIAAMKFGGEVSLTGSAEFRERMARLATRQGMRVVDADLARIVEDERSRMTGGERVTTSGAAPALPDSGKRPDPTAAQLARWWNPKSRVERIHALDAAQRAGCERSVVGAWHAARDAVERRHAGISADQLEREDGQTRNPNSEPEPEPDDEQDLGR